jgi:hypothetical protein
MQVFMSIKNNILCTTTRALLSTTTKFPHYIFHGRNTAQFLLCGVYPSQRRCYANGSSYVTNVMIIWHTRCECESTWNEMGQGYYCYYCIRQLVKETYGNIAVNLHVGTKRFINTIKRKRQTEMVSCFTITYTIITNGFMGDNEKREEKEDV